MKISFFLDNSNCRRTDFSNPKNGNPGVGGTQYMFSLISWYYAKRTADRVTVYAPDISKMPEETHNVETSTLKAAVDRAIIDKVDYFICRTPNDKSFYDYLKKTTLNVILWGHNFAFYRELNWASHCNNIKKYICVSEEQLRLLEGHSIYKKSTYIYNAILPEIYEINEYTEKISNSICYIGSIVDTKGFDVCAKVWRRLYDNGYKTELHIIGSGQLYNKSAILGKYKIADSKYEKKFIKRLTDKKGELLPEVHFHGVLNHMEKMQILKKMQIGMPNPTGKTETFGISAIELEVAGVPVITRNRGGLKNTVDNGKSGWLCNSEEELYNACVKVLQMSVEDYCKHASYAKLFTQKFNIELIIQEWITLLEELETKKELLCRNNINEPKLVQMKNIINLMLYKQ